MAFGQIFLEAVTAYSKNVRKFVSLTSERSSHTLFLNLFVLYERKESDWVGCVFAENELPNGFAENESPSRVDRFLRVLSAISRTQTSFENSNIDADGAEAVAGEVPFRVCVGVIWFLALGNDALYAHHWPRHLAERSLNHVVFPSCCLHLISRTFTASTAGIVNCTLVAALI